MLTSQALAVADADRVAVRPLAAGQCTVRSLLTRTALAEGGNCSSQPSMSPRRCALRKWSANYQRAASAAKSAISTKRGDRAALHGTNSSKSESAVVALSSRSTDICSASAGWIDPLVDACAAAGAQAGGSAVHAAHREARLRHLRSISASTKLAVIAATLAQCSRAGRLARCAELGVGPLRHPRSDSMVPKATPAYAGSTGAPDGSQQRRGGRAGGSTRRCGTKYIELARAATRGGTGYGSLEDRPWTTPARSRSRVLAFRQSVSSGPVTDPAGPAAFRGRDGQWVNSPT